MTESQKSASNSVSAGLDFNWGYGAPAEGLPADDFSARRTAQATFQGGAYRFLTSADDGGRLYVDGEHDLEVKFYENVGDAPLRDLPLPESWGALVGPDLVEELLNELGEQVL